jgi:hypothetical protein
MKSSRRLNQILTLFLFLVSIVLIAGITGFGIPTASASASTSATTGTQLPTTTSTTVITSTNTPTGTFHPITWKQLVDFLAKDHTNWNQYNPGKYTCLEFSMDLVANAGQQGIKAWIVAVDFIGGGPGHAFVAFETADRGIIYVEPQADDTYPIVKIGSPLCDAWGVYQCVGKVSSIEYLQCENANYCTKFTP